MISRCLLETFKFLPLDCVFQSVTLVSPSWHRITLAEELLLHFIHSLGCGADHSRSYYDQVKELSSCPNFLLHLVTEGVNVWNVILNESKFIGHELLDLTARYALDSWRTAVVTGGQIAKKKCLRINLVTGCVTPLADMQHERIWHSSAFYMNKVVVSGGSLPKSEPFPIKFAEQLDGELWTQLPEMTKPRFNHTMVVYLQKLFVFGGTSGRGMENSAEIFAENKWQQAAILLPTARNYSSLISVKGILILAGGFDLNIQQKVVCVLDEDRWEVVGRFSGKFTLSNAITWKKGKLFFFDHSAKKFILDFAIPQRGSWTSAEVPQIFETTLT